MASIEVIRKIEDKGLLVTPEAAALSDEELMILADIAIERKEFLVKPGLERIKEEKKEDEDVFLLDDIKTSNEKKSFEHFVEYYLRRYEYLSKIIMNRPGMEHVSSIARLREGMDASIIGMVREKIFTRNGNYLLIVEDPTGKRNVFVTKNNEEAYEEMKNIVLDEVIGIKGIVSRNNSFIASQIFYPGIPPQPLKKGPEEEYILFLGDTHFGSKLFLKKEFESLIKWIRGEIGNERQKEISRKIKYIIIVGDIIEGVGIYPGQEEDLEEKTISDQLKIATEYLSRIPKDKKIILIPGNHDPVRVEEPQPPIPENYAKELYGLENIYFFPNPSTIVIGKKKDFPGFKVLLYHGSSLVYYSDEIEHIRMNGGQKRVDDIMKILLEKRHLAPTKGSSLFIPNPYDDPLLIKNIPDFFVTGHIHRVMAVSNYKGISLINASCWVEKSEDQERRGLEPQPGRAILANLKTRELKIFNFYSNE